MSIRVDEVYTMGLALERASLAMDSRKIIYRGIKREELPDMMAANVRVVPRDVFDEWALKRGYYLVDMGLPEQPETLDDILSPKSAKIALKYGVRGAAISRERLRQLTDTYGGPLRRRAFGVDEPFEGYGAPGNCSYYFWKDIIEWVKNHHSNISLSNFQRGRVSHSESSPMESR